jgi:hypothetical protein
LSGSSVTFHWTAGIGVAGYQLWLGNSPGTSDLYKSNGISATSVTADGLPSNWLPVFARLLSKIGGVWEAVDYTYTEAGTPITPVLAAITSPAPGSTLSSSVTFHWTTGVGVAAYELWLGTGPGTSELYKSSGNSTTSVTVYGLPTSGVTVFARLWSKIGGVWLAADYTYKEAGTLIKPVLASITSPPPGSDLENLNFPGEATFQWTAGVGVTAYELWLGTRPGTSDLYNSNGIFATSVFAHGWPRDGLPVYARLWSKTGGIWEAVDYTYANGGPTTPALAAITSPAPGSTFPYSADSSVTFNWTAGVGVAAYELWLGSVRGAANLYNSGGNTALSAKASGLPTNGAPVYARLWSKIGGVWQWTDYVYTAYKAP